VKKYCVLSGLLLVLALLPIQLVPPAYAEKPVGTAIATTSRPANWAEPVTVAGVPNLNRVTPTLYRSAQPLKAGFPNLISGPNGGIGIKTVISLRAFHSDAKLAKSTSLRLVSVPIKPWNIHTQDVVQALAEIRRAEAEGPVLLHCLHGADRTGLITAMYRLLYQGWSKADAETEMRQGNFGYHAVWGNIPRFIANADLADIKRRVDAVKF
jgi:protein tyrosine/serine phosphatase